jgi:hypothetical protein
VASGDIDASAWTFDSARPEVNGNGAPAEQTSRRRKAIRNALLNIIGDPAD